jgi:hypothetical protein
MIREAREMLEGAGYELEPNLILIKADMPSGYRGMTLDFGAILGEEAFSSQAMLIHVLEEELLHLRQKAAGKAREFLPGTAHSLEEEVHETRRFPCPDN